MLVSLKRESREREAKDWPWDRTQIRGFGLDTSSLAGHKDSLCVSVPLVCAFVFLPVIQPCVLTVWSQNLEHLENGGKY